MATLHLMVGLPCSGKTILARQIENEQSALRLTPDEWQVTLFGQDAAEPEHDARHSLIEAMLWDLAARLLVLGTSVILDYGFWAREEREDFRARAEKLGASSEVHFLDVSEEELLRRLAARNSETPPGAFRISVAMMKRYITVFQAPTARSQSGAPALFSLHMEAQPSDEELPPVLLKWIVRQPDMAKLVRS